MPLPKIDLPIYELKLVSQPQPVKFRPFLVKEEKLLLMALQSDDESNIYNTIKQVINNCLITELDIERLPIFDVEYLFLQLRAHSVSEVVDSYFMCKNKIAKEETDEEGVVTVTEEQCSHLMPVKVTLTEIKPPIADLPSKISITESIGIQLKFPTLRNMNSIKEVIASEDNDAVFKMVYECLDYIYDEDGVYYARESSYEEFCEFVDSLTQEQFNRVTSFFERLPKIEHDVEHVCEKCGFLHKLHMEGLTDFFI